MTRPSDPADITAELAGYARKGLILSWRHVEGRGWAVVVGADMDETELKTPHEAWLFCGGLASAAAAIRDGRVQA